MITAVWVWAGVPAAQALPAVAHSRMAIRALPFAKLLGTADGLSPRPDRWLLVAAVPDRAALETCERTAVVRRWDGLAAQRTRFVLRPMTARGTWSGRRAFGEPGGGAWSGPVAAITRARVRMRHWRRFRAAVPPVVGASFAVGFGEWPVGLLGTFSVWGSAAALESFRDGADHAAARQAAREGGWFGEEMYARFAVTHADGPLA